MTARLSSGSPLARLKSFRMLCHQRGSSLNVAGPVPAGQRFIIIADNRTNIPNFTDSASHLYYPYCA
ncbi:hypothetical protein KCP76_13015 [Salmonella enterica subsp. enterica serovar Weltevreden]|nr:hypothetical protein KCP76_13015 [Salmonella enterica subsp. enterica serovar Weltevreden]